MKSSPTILAIEAATEVSSVALQINGERFEKTDNSERKATEFILPLIHALLSEQKINISNLDVIAFSKGPGAFTGVRLCASVTQGLAMPHNISVIGISTLACLAQTAYEQTNDTSVITLVDARRQEVYLAVYHLSGQVMIPLLSDQLILPEKINLAELELTEYHGIGNGWRLYQDQIPPMLLTKLKKIRANIVPQATAMLTLAQHAYHDGLCVKAQHALPIYLRDPIDN